MAASKSSSSGGPIPGEENVNAAKELRSAMEAMVGISASLERSFENQARAVRKMVKEMGSMGTVDVVTQVGQLGESLKKALELLQQLTGQSGGSFTEIARSARDAGTASRDMSTQVREAGNAAATATSTSEELGNVLGEVSNSTEDLNKKFNKVGKYLKKEYPVAIGVALGAMSGLAQGFRNFMALGKGLFGVLGSLVSTLFEVGVAIISIPFQLFDGLINLAKKSAGGSNELATAIEKVRENFGALSNTTPKAIFATAKALGRLQLQGTNSFRVFGNLAQRIEKINALFFAGGPAIRNLSDEFVSSGGALLGYQKGLGLTDEMMGSIAQRAQSMGEPMQKTLKDITKQSLHLGAAFKLDAKIISREMGKAAMDMRHFGDVSIKQIGVAVTYAHKLGIDLEKITGIMDQFSTFDAAAENVSKLNEAFGTNINAMEMLQAESPAEQLEILRKEMSRVGVDGEKLNRHYRSLISQTTGLDDATIKSALSSKNQGVSLKEIEKQATKAEKKTMTQAEAMNKLADAMERMVQSGGDMGPEGFFGQYFKGIVEGMTSTAEFRKILMNIVAALRTVYMEGRRLGQQIVQLFPGLKEFLDGLGDLFSPAKFKKLAGGVTDVIIEWMKGLTDPSKKFSFSTLMEKIQDKFFDFFNSEKPAGSKVISGFRKIMDTISTILGEAATWAMGKMTELFNFLANLIKDPSSVLGGLGAAKDGIAGFFAPLFSAIAEAWPALSAAFINLMSAAFDALFKWVSTSLWPVIEPYMKYVYAGLAVILFGPAVLQATLGAATGFFTKLLLEGIKGGVVKAAASGLLGKAIQGLVSASASVPGAANVGPAVGGAGGAMAAGNNIPRRAVEGSAGLGASLGRNLPKIILMFTALAAIIVIGVAAFAVAAKIMEGISTEAIVKAAMALGVVILAAIPAAIGAHLITKVTDPEKVLKGGLVIGALVLVMGAVGGLLAAMLSMIEPSALTAAGDFLIDIAKVFLLMIPLIVASTMVGAIMSAAPWLAAFAAGGLAVIGLFVLAVAEIAVVVMSQITSMSFDPSFGPKSKIFIDIMSIIQKLADTLVSMLRIMQPSFNELNKGISFKDKVDKSVELLEAFVGKKGGKSGIIGLIEVIIDAIKDPLFNTGIIKTGKIFAEILQAVTSLIQALTPPPEFYEVQTSLINIIDPSIGNSVTEQVKGYLQKFVDNVGVLIEKITGSITKLAAIKVPDVKNAEIVVQLFSAIVNLVKSMTPPDSVVKDFETTFTTVEKENSKKTTLTSVDKEALQSYLTTRAVLIEIFTGRILDTFIEKVESTLRYGPATLAKLEKILPLFKIVPDLMNSIAKLLEMGTAKSSVTTKSLDVMGGEMERTMVSEVDKIKPVFTSLGENLPTLFNAIFGLTDKIKISDKIAEKVAVIKDVFTALKEITSAMSEISEAVSITSEGGVKEVDPNASIFLRDSVDAIVDLLDQNGANKIDFGAVFSAIEGAYNELASGGDPAAISKKIKTISETINAISGAAASMSSLKDLGGGSFDTAGVKTAFTNVTTALTSLDQQTVSNLANALGPKSEVIKNTPTITSGVQVLGSLVNQGFVPLAQTLGTAVAGITGGGTSNFDQFANAIKGVAGSEEARTAFAKDLGFVTETVKSMASNSLVPLIQQIDTVNKEGKKLADSLSKGDWVTTVPAALRAFAQKSGASGVGASGTKYSINTSPVNITVNFAIAIDSKELEKTLITRKDSYIRDRVHYLLGLTVGKDSKDVYNLQKDGKGDAKLGEYEKKAQIPGNGEEPEMTQPKAEPDKK